MAADSPARGSATPGRPPPAGSTPDPDVTFDRVLFLRHLAIFAGAVVAYLQRSELGIGWSAVAVVTASALLNFVCSFLHRRRGLERLAAVASSVVGVGCWTIMAAVTGGAAGSPFLAGLWLEIILAAMLFALSGIVAVTLFSIVGLSALELALGFPTSPVTLALQTGFLASMGGLSYLVARHALRREAALTRERDVLDERLAALDRQLEQEREVGRVGENVARLAHGLKNAVHSLRGFASLIEPTVGGRAGGNAALAGLRTAIDDLESLARLTLAPAEDDAHKERCEPGEVVERAVREVSLADPQVAWSVHGGVGTATAAIAAESLHEVLVVLLRNAVEAMQGRGAGEVQLGTRDGDLVVQVRDEGPGIDPSELARIFDPGYTTKSGGSGYGLFLARRLLVGAGGSLAARRSERGALMEIAVPLSRRGAAAAEAVRTAS